MRIEDKKKSKGKEVIEIKTTDKKVSYGSYDWWNAKSKQELCDMVLATAEMLKMNQNQRVRQAAVHARLYSNMSLFNFAGANLAKIDSTNNLPPDRPTFNLVQSSIDTLVSKLTLNKPTPVFLTDNSDYKERNLAKKMNNFIAGELYQTQAYAKGEFVLRDALIFGDGCFKVFRTKDDRVGLERVLCTELAVDQNEAIYGDPRSLYQFKLVDRQVLAEMFGEEKAKIKRAGSAYADNSSKSTNTVSDMVMVVEAWRLPSCEGAEDGRHVIICDSGDLLDEPWKKSKFPFVFLHYSPRMLGFWSQGVAEQLTGTQLSLNSLLWTISKSIELTGVPRIFVEQGSKVLNAAHNNEIGSIVTYQGTKPSYEVAPCNASELYLERDKLITYGFQQIGVSMLQASSQKPAGLNSGEAIRSYDDIANDRFAALQRRYNNMYIDLSYQIIELACEIAEETGSYKTVYPNKNGAKEIDLPLAKKLKKDPVIQCYDISSLPRDPSGRLAKITEMIQAGMITIQEGRRLIDFADLDQVETLANAGQERIYKYLDEIIETGKYTPPDPFMPLDLADQICTQYYNLYVACNLEQSKVDLLINFSNQVKDLKALAQQAMAPPQPTPLANPEPLPTSPLVPFNQ